MSQAARLFAARAALEAIERASRDGQPAIAELARLGLVSSGETPAQASRREADVTRKRTARGHPAPSGGLPADGARTARGHEGGVGGGVSSDLPDQERDLPAHVGGTGGGPADGARTAQADGAFGMTCDSWAEGVRTVTGGFFPAPRGKAAGDLAKALQGALALFPGVDACESARKAGEAYARAQPGRTLDSYDFGRWLGSGRPARTPPKAIVAVDPVRAAEEAKERNRALEARVLENARREREKEQEAS